MHVRVSRSVMSDILWFHGLQLSRFLCPWNSPRVLELVAISSSRESSWAREWTWVSCIVGRFFTVWTTREAQMDMYTLVYLKWVTNKDLLYHTWNSAQCYMAAWMGGKLAGCGRGVDTCIRMAKPLCCSPESITTLLIGYTPIQNKKIFKKRLQVQANR